MITAKLLLINDKELRRVYCPGENYTFYMAWDTRYTMNLITCEYETNKVYYVDHGIELQSTFAGWNDGNVYYIGRGCNRIIEKTNVLTEKKEIVIDNIDDDFKVDHLASCGQWNMLAMANETGIYAISLKNGELKRLNDENWARCTDMAYSNGVLYLLHNTNLYSFDLESKKYTKLLENLTNEDYARLVIKNDIFYFFGELPTKMRTYNLKSQERAEIKILIDYQESLILESLILNSEGNVIFFTGEQIWELTLN